MDAFLYQNHQFMSRNHIQYLGVLGLQIDVVDVIFPERSRFDVVLLDENNMDTRICLLNAIVSRASDKNMGLTFQDHDTKTLKKLIYFITALKGENMTHQSASQFAYAG